MMDLWIEVLVGLVLAVFGYGLGLRNGRRILAKRVRKPSPELVGPITSTQRKQPPGFTVVSEGKVRYSGDSGGAARRCIEGLRVRGVKWTAERRGDPWDWGPR